MMLATGWSLRTGKRQTSYGRASFEVTGAARVSG